jgi:hypothetical protein
MNPLAKKTAAPSAAQKDRTEIKTVADKPCARPRRDQRKATRYPVQPEHQFCELQVGDNVLSTLLVNESQTGFAVMADRLSGLKTGNKVRLHTHKGWFTVEIVYIREIAPPRDVDLSVEVLFWLGLKKMRGSFFS